jgi:hypothetical protein
MESADLVTARSLLNWLLMMMTTFDASSSSSSSSNRSFISNHIQYDALLHFAHMH